MTDEEILKRIKEDNLSEEEIDKLLEQLSDNTKNVFATFIAMYNIQDVLDWYKNGKIDDFFDEIKVKNDKYIKEVVNVIDDRIETQVKEATKNKKVEYKDKNGKIKIKKVGYLTEKQVKDIINERLKEYNYKEKYNEHYGYFNENVKKAIIQGMISGKNPNKIAKDIEKYAKSLANKGKTLMRTETSIIQTTSQKKQYKESGVEFYEWIEEPDACSSCKEWLGKKLPTKDMEAGVNAPSIHPNCRCSTIPVIS